MGFINIKNDKGELVTIHTSQIRGTPWQEGYLEGRVKSGKAESNPHAPETQEFYEWANGFHSGRDDARFGL